MNTGDWWWDAEDQHPAKTTIVPVISASGMADLTNF